LGKFSSSNQQLVREAFVSEGELAGLLNGRMSLESAFVSKRPRPGFDVAAVPNPLEGDDLFKGSGRGVFLINQLMTRLSSPNGAARC
jgi:hypothetical protein